jgi:hypothetical protein
MAVASIGHEFCTNCWRVKSNHPAVDRALMLESIP